MIDGVATPVVNMVDFTPVPIGTIPDIYSLTNGKTASQSVNEEHFIFAFLRVHSIRSINAPGDIFARPMTMTI